MFARFDFVRLRVFSLCVSILCMLTWPNCDSTICSAQEVKDLPPDHGIDGTQPPIYWHDATTNIDLDASTKNWSVVVSEKSGTVTRVQLPDILNQVCSIRRASPDRIVVLAYLPAGANYVGVIDIRSAKIIDEFWSSALPALSPNNRYVLFQRFYPMHGAVGYDAQYRLYDVLGTKALNWPERPKDTKHTPSGEPINYDDTKAGVPVYPLSADELARDNTNVPEGKEHTLISDFVWNSNSKKAAFADITNGRISLVVVSVPSKRNEGPKTFVHEIPGIHKQLCSAKTLEWTGQNVKARMLCNSHDKPNIEIRIDMPVSRFQLAKK